MTNRSQGSFQRSFFRGRGLLVLALALGLAVLLLPRYAPNVGSRRSVAQDDDAGVSEARITRLEEPSGARIRARDRPRSTFQTPVKSGVATSATVVQDTSTTDTGTTVPLQQEAYLLALMAMMEMDGRDNALIHYALAAEVAPPHPSSEQVALIELVLREGWDERAEPLLPYLLAWQDAFEKLHFGADLNYARGIGYEMGQNTPGPNYLKIREAPKMLAVYSRYLESQGQGGDALRQLETILSMGRDFNSPDNTIVTNLIGTSFEDFGLRQLSEIVSSDALTPSQLAAANDHLKNVELGQPAIQSVIDGEMQTALNSYREIMSDPAYAEQSKGGESAQDVALSVAEYEKAHQALWTSLSEQFSTPYWERDPVVLSTLSGVIPMPNFTAAEVRFLSVTSRLRQQQIDVAAQRYLSDHQALPRDIETLVNQSYLPSNPVDPFTGTPFTYKPNGDGYQLFGSGPNIGSPQEPDVDWSPTKGVLSGGVIRTR